MPMPASVCIGRCMPDIACYVCQVCPYINVCLQRATPELLRMTVSSTSLTTFETRRIDAKSYRRGIAFKKRFAYDELTTDFLVWSNPTQSNRRSAVQ